MLSPGHGDDKFTKVPGMLAKARTNPHMRSGLVETFLECILNMSRGISNKKLFYIVLR